MDWNNTDHWEHLKSKIKLRWQKLDEQDLVRIAGRRHKLLDTLQERYGYSLRQAELEMRKLERTYH